MGNLPAGIIMGATMELALVGAVSIGAYNPPDLIAGTVFHLRFSQEPERKQL